MRHIAACGELSSGLFLVVGSSQGAVHLLSLRLEGDDVAGSAAAVASMAAGATADAMAPPSVATVGVGIFHGLERAFASGVPLGEVMESLEELVGAVRARAEAADDEADDTAAAPKACVVCMEALRAVRFTCGHCVCCDGCAKKWRAAGGGCPSCRKPMVVVQRGDLSRAPSFERRPQ